MKIIATLCLLSLAFCGYSQANTDEIALMQQLYGMEKREIISGFVQFDSDDNKTVFWETYDEYEAERKEQGARRYKLLEQYVNDYLTMGETELSELLDASIKLRADSQKLLSKYTKKMRKAVGTKQAAQFYQIENYLNNAVSTSLAEQIPFIGELD